MRTLAKLPLLLAGALCLEAWITCAVAQEDAAPIPTPASAPAPAVSEPPPYPLDLPELHPSGNGTGLFPGEPRQNPPTASRNSGRNRRSPLQAGTKQKGRSRDRTLQQADSDPLAIRIAYRRAKTTALARDPELSELLRRADTAVTDDQKRQYLHEYYTRLFASIRRLDSSSGMKTHLTLLSQVAEQQYDPKRRSVAGEELLLNTREIAGRERLGR